MANVTSTTDDNNNKVFNIDLEPDESSVVLATANTYVDKNIVINIPLDEKADIDSPALTGTPTVNGKEIVTEEDITEGLRGRSVLNITTAPYSNTLRTPDGKVHSMAAFKADIIKESGVSNVMIGDICLYKGSLYLVAYIDEKASASTRGVYLDLVGSIIGPKGEQGEKGNAGDPGPQGEPGEGYFIVTDEDYEKIAEYIEENTYKTYKRSTTVEPLKPNVFYEFGTQYSMNITFVPPTSDYRTNEYMFQFTSPTDRPTTLSLPSSVKWCYDPVIEAGKTYQISIMNGLAVICGA